MRVFYWNARGLDKDGAKDKLKELYHLHNHDIICIAEPLVRCTTRFVRSLRLIDFCEDVITNEGGGEKGNIWVLWRSSLSRPSVCSSSKQAITFEVDGRFILVVHASFDQVVRKTLWCQLGLGSISLPCKLKRLKEAMKVWNRTVYGELEFRLKQAELKLESESDLLDYDPAHEDDIKDFIVNHYKDKFNGGEVDIDPKLFDVNHESISSSESTLIYVVPTLEEIKEAVFDLGEDSAPVPDGFSGFLYKTCWDIIADDLFNVIVNCWTLRRIPNGIESSFIMLICKNGKSDAIKDFRPIGLSNFFFKIITKIMSTRLGMVLNKLISEEQVAFIKGMNIHEIVALSSELINEINANRKFGNVGLKLDIAQAFDTVSWKFIKEVFRQYGFSDTWCGFINSILISARISVMVNGSPEGFFSISRGLRQGDPLSPLIFVLIEDILSRNIYNMFARRSMHHMVIKKGVSPTHLLFADDILVFCRAWQVVEKIMEKFAGWKGKLLYFQARLVLIKSVISSYVIHSMAVYKWPCSITKKVERAIRNFLWSGDAEKRKHFTVLYDNLCCSRREGGLGIPRLLDVNKAMLMKLWISIRDSDKTWAIFLREKYLKNNGNLIDYKLGSSVFPGIRFVYNFVQKHTRAIISDGASTTLFFDNWCGDSIAKRLGISSKGPADFNSRVSDIITDGAWCIPPNTINLMIRCNIDIDNLSVIAGGEDYKIWDLDKKGIFFVKSAKAALKVVADVHPTAALFSRKVVHPTLSVQYWNIWVNYFCASDDNVIKKLAGSCLQCVVRVEEVASL
ncbi:uncharacterized protein LOC113291859 [Papaver somniferum]|uniref:uncharacterized protein LOC113291859 n=1 Tax=Papaver somniferum TaxID=3469 RepID=UPI000E6F5230|nr:uncharacterized protein LOC113291859 [Papaver somniferum]